MTYRLEDRARLGRIGLAVVVLVVASVSVQAQETVPVEGSLTEWADTLWDAGIDGDEALMQKLIHLPPESISTPEAVARYKQCVQHWQRTHDASVAELEAARSVALTSLDQALSIADLSEALKHAVTYQELLQDYDEALTHPSVRVAVDRADAAIGALVEQGLLMQAQELLFRLKTVHEDTQHVARFTRFDERLDDVSTQLQLVRRYDPAGFHELYRNRARARGDDPSEMRAFNPALMDRWKEEVRGVRVDILRSVLDTAAREHINSGGWAPLMSGGVDALQELTQTPMLNDVFTGLGDPVTAMAWQQGLEDIENRIDDTFTDTPHPRHQGRVIIDEIAQLNADTIDLPTEVIWREFGDGAMDELDRFTEVIWPYDIEDFNRQMQGEFIGIGIYIEETDLGEIRVVSPLEGKPAAVAGIRAGDLIVGVDGQTAAGWSLRDAVRSITGPARTTVQVTVRHEDSDEERTYGIVRDVIRMHTVKGWDHRGVDDEGNPIWGWFIDPEHRIGYIRMTGFDQRTYADLLAAISQMQADRGMPLGLLLDLRHNPGGLLETAVNVSNLFVGEGRIVSGEDRLGQASFHATARKRKAYLAGTPVVVLINNGSASASEIVAGCLQAHEAAIVVGARSFGKGSVQTVHPVTENAKLKLTTQYYRLPSIDGITPGRMVHKIPGKPQWGVEPDIIVSMTPDQIIESIKVQREAELQQPPADWDAQAEGPWAAPSITQLLDEGLDPQLHTALVILQAKAFGDRPALAGR